MTRNITEILHSWFAATTETEEPESTLRLVDGPDSSSGRVEIFREGQWGTICDDDWQKEEADVVCRQLGFPEAIRFSREAEFGPGNAGFPILYSLTCDGTETNIEDCQTYNWRTLGCSHNEDAGVVCKSETGKSCALWLYVFPQVAVMRGTSAPWWQYREWKCMNLIYKILCWFFIYKYIL